MSSKNTFEKQSKILAAFDKTFNPDDFQSCVNRAMLLIRNREAQMIDEGYEWPIATDTCHWAIEQAIINRASGVSMMAAAIECVESVENQAEEHNGI